jgi:hypothetical protein
MICPICGSNNTKKRGFAFANGGKKQRYFCHAHSGSFLEGQVVEDSFPSVLLVDIETLPIVAYTWSGYDTVINPVQIIKDWCVVGWAAQWLGDDKIVSEFLTPKEAKSRNDKKIVSKLWKMFDEADSVIAHNGIRFDFKKLNTRWWYHGLPQPSSYKMIDTLEIARRTLGMTFNSLDYLGEYLGLGKKLHTDFELWRRCSDGSPEALQEMREYNENDVDLLRKVYLKLRGWTNNHPDFRAFSRVKGVCPRCFSPIEYIGLYTAKKNQYKEFRCTGCGGVGHDTNPIR